MLYAIGIPNQVARCLLDTTPQEVGRQVGAGEVAVPVSNATQTFIAANGGSAMARTTVTMAPIITAPQLATAIPVPVGSTWSANGKSYVGPQSITFAAAGAASIEMTGAWSGTSTVTILSVADYQAWLLGLVDDEAERRKMLVLTPGGAKKMEYDAKRGEVEAYYSLGGNFTAIAAALLNLTTEQRARRFRYANAEAALTGDTLAIVIARFRDGADANQAESARLSAITQKAKRAIRTAATGAAKLAAYAAINWSAS